MRIKFEGQSGAKRQSEYVWMIQTKRRDEIGQAPDEIRNTEVIGRIRRVAAARHVPGHHRELVRQRIDLVTKLLAMRWTAM